MEPAKPSPLRPLSLNSAGPRSLQLRFSHSPPWPPSPSAATSPSRPSHLKRASTISYSPRSPSTCAPQSPAGDPPQSYTVNSTPSRRASLRAARRTSYDPSLALDSMLSSSLTSPPVTAAPSLEEPEPITLVERYVVAQASVITHPWPCLPFLTISRYMLYRHAELLQNIAAKEAICLDLRSQLAAQEEDLRTLKAEWSSIVDRDAPQLMTGPSSSKVLSQGKDFVNGLLAIANGAGSGPSISPRNKLLFPLVPPPTEGELTASAPASAPAPAPTPPKGHLSHTRSTSATPSDSSRSSSVSGSSLARNSVSSMSSITEGPNLHTAALKSGHIQHGINLPGPSYTPLAPISAWTATLPSLDSLPGTINKKWEEIQKNETYVILSPFMRPT